jgi:hypothetical protein
MWVEDENLCQTEGCGWVRVEQYPEVWFANPPRKNEEGDEEPEEEEEDRDGERVAFERLVLEKQKAWWAKRNAAPFKVAKICCASFFREFGVPKDVAYIIAEFVCARDCDENVSPNQKKSKIE